MKNLLHLVFILMATCVVGALGQDAPLPPAADTILKAYERESTASRDKAVRQLQAVMTEETKRGKLESALAVKAAIERLAPKADPAAVPAAPPPSTPGVANVPAQGGRVAVKANVPTGAELGSFAAGIRLTVQYVEGKWYLQHVADPLKWVSPDEVPVTPADEKYSNNLGIFALENGKATLLETVPPNTKKKPFHYRFKKPYSMVILRIRDDIPEDNPGFAVYDTTIGK